MTLQFFKAISCCIIFAGAVCKHHDEEFAVGESMMVDMCTRRTCSESGLWREEDLTLQCEYPTGCTFLTQPAGQCCLVCKGK